MKIRLSVFAISERYLVIKETDGMRIGKKEGGSVQEKERREERKGGRATFGGPGESSGFSLLIQ